MIVIHPVPGVKYYYHELFNVYIDVEMFRDRVIMKGKDYVLNLIKQHALNYAKKHKLL
jgi:hypothetical protein